MSVTVPVWDKARILTSIGIIKDGDTSTYVPVTIVNRVKTNIITPYELGHSISQWNSYIIEKPPEYTYTIVLPVISKEVAMLRDIQSAGLFFEMTLEDANANSNEREYQLGVEYFRYCKLTKNEREITVGEVPMVTFDGIAMEYSYDYWRENGDNWELTTVTDGVSTNRQWFGHGNPLSGNADMFVRWIKS